MPLRLAPLPESEWDADAREVLDGIRASGGRLLNIFTTLAHHPKLLKRWLVFGNHVLLRSSLPPRERELAILRVGWLCRSEYEWGQHVEMSRQLGLGEDEIRRVCDGPAAAGWDPFEATLLRAVDELHADSRIGDATWQALGERYDDKQRLDLVFTVGQYTLVAMALNTLGVELDEGIEGFPR